MTNASVRIIDRFRNRPRIKGMFRIILGLETMFLLGVKFCLVLSLRFMGRIRTNFRQWWWLILALEIRLEVGLISSLGLHFCWLYVRVVLQLALGCDLTLLLSFVIIPFTVGVIVRVISWDDAGLIELCFAFQPGLHLVLKIGF